MLMTKNDSQILNNGSQKGPITLRKSEKASAYTITFEDFSDTNDEGNPDQTSQRPRLERQDHQRKIRSTIKLSGQKMKQDVYGMLFLSKPFSPSFFFALFSIFFQYIILCFLMYDLIDHKSSRNPLRIPTGVTPIVSVSQAFGVILAVLSSEDLLDALAFFDIILHSEIFDIIPNATIGSWFLSWFLKFIEGSVSLLVIFILLLSSETVLSLFLNFAALSFVWAIDDVIFKLAKHGFFGDIITESAFSTTVITLPKNATKRSIYIRNFAFYLITIVMFAVWISFYIRQRDGYFSCNHILAQFGDSYEPVTSRFSGHFKVEKNVRLYNRYVYTNRRNNDTAYPFIAYCEPQDAWTLSQFNETNGYDSCTDPLAWSPTTSTFDITEAGNSWVSVQRNDTKKKKIPYTTMKIECIDCLKEMNPFRDDCSFSGICGDDGLCICNTGDYGLSCEYKAPCNIKSMSRDGNDNQGPKNKFIIGQKFQLLEDVEKKLVMVQEKPVYYSIVNETDRSSKKNNTDGPPQNNKPPQERNLDEKEFTCEVIFFNGFRWVVTRSFPYKKEMSTYTNVGNITSQLANFLTNIFHPYYSPYESEVMSAPMPQSIPGDGFTPTNVAWYIVREDTNLLHEDQGSVMIVSPLIAPFKCDED